MTPREANRIIAEYMGYKYDDSYRGFYGNKWLRPNGSRIMYEHDDHGCTDFISLDALVPVWEEMEKCCVLEINRHNVKGYNWCYFPKTDIDEYSEGDCIKQAAAIATAKAILEIKECAK